MYVCTKHFPEGRSTEKYPDPLPADQVSLDKYTPVRQPPKRRPATDLPKKRRRLLSEHDISNQENQSCQTSNASEKVTTSEAAPSNTDTPKELSPLDMLALAAENKILQQQLDSQVLLYEEPRRDNATLKDKNNQKEENRQKRSRSFNIEAVKERVQ